MSLHKKKRKRLHRKRPVGNRNSLSRRPHLEVLEDRRMLANNILLDFTPDTIDGEYAAGRFVDMFDGSAVTPINQFLNYDDSNSVIDAEDAKIGAGKDWRSSRKD